MNDDDNLMGDDQNELNDLMGDDDDAALMGDDDAALMGDDDVDNLMGDDQNELNALMGNDDNNWMGNDENNFVENDGNLIGDDDTIIAENNSVVASGSGGDDVTIINENNLEDNSPVTSGSGAQAANAQPPGLPGSSSGASGGLIGSQQTGTSIAGQEGQANGGHPAGASSPQAAEASNSQPAGASICPDKYADMMPKRGEPGYGSALENKREIDFRTVMTRTAGITATCRVPGCSALLPGEKALIDHVEYDHQDIAIDEKMILWPCNFWCGCKCGKKVFSPKDLQIHFDHVRSCSTVIRNTKRSFRCHRGHWVDKETGVEEWIAHFRRKGRDGCDQTEFYVRNELRKFAVQYEDTSERLPSKYMAHLYQTADDDAGSSVSEAPEPLGEPSSSSQPVGPSGAIPAGGLTWKHLLTGSASPLRPANDYYDKFFGMSTTPQAGVARSPVIHPFGAPDPPPAEDSFHIPTNYSSPLFAGGRTTHSSPGAGSAGNAVANLSGTAAPGPSGSCQQPPVAAGQSSQTLPSSMQFGTAAWKLEASQHVGVLLSDKTRSICRACGVPWLECRFWTVEAPGGS